MNHLKKEGKTMNQRKKCLCIISLLLMGLLFDIHIEATKVKAENMTQQVLAPKGFQGISENAKIRDARKEVVDEILKNGKRPSGLRNRIDMLYAPEHRKLLQKYAKESMLSNSKELLANQIEYGSSVYVIKGHANIKGYIKDVLKEFLPLEDSDDWIKALLNSQIKTGKDGIEETTICEVMGQEGASLKIDDILDNISSIKNNLRIIDVDKLCKETK